MVLVHQKGPLWSSWVLVDNFNGGPHGVWWAYEQFVLNFYVDRKIFLAALKGLGHDRDK